MYVLRKQKCDVGRLYLGIESTGLSVPEIDRPETDRVGGKSSIEGAFTCKCAGYGQPETHNAALRHCSRGAPAR
jgi:hypothetical protein